MAAARDSVRGPQIRGSNVEFSESTHGFRRFIRPDSNSAQAFSIAASSASRLNSSSRSGRTRPAVLLSQHLVHTYAHANPNFKYLAALNPRRVLTKPSEPTNNEGHDNANADYILYVNDVIGSYSKHQYGLLSVYAR